MAEPPPPAVPWPLSDFRLDGRVALIPAGRLGTPDDLVGAAILLCTDVGRYINGADLFVDGGRIIGG